MSEALSFSTFPSTPPYNADFDGDEMNMQYVAIMDGGARS